jgi:hypothetical protein
MSGIELKTKALTINPDIKVILITGVSDPQFQRKVADAGADAFFFKPIVMKSLLNTVENLLELEKTGRQAEDAVPSPAFRSYTPEIDERLASLRDELDAISVVLLQTNGHVNAMIGTPPDGAVKSDLVPMFLHLLGTGNKVSQLINKEIPEDLYCISGDIYNFSMTHVKSDHCLLVITNAGPGAEYLGTIGFSIRIAAQDLSELLTKVALVSATEIVEEDTVIDKTKTDDEYQAQYTDTDLSETTIDDDIEEDLPDVEDIFQTKDGESPSPDDIDAFWDWPLEASDTGSLKPTSDSLSYDEASELGLTPDRDED